MKHRVVSVLAVLVLALTITGSALAFDCMRVSSSLNGLQQSTKSGNWLLFDMTAGGGGVAQVLDFFGVHVTSDQLACSQAAYTRSGARTYFALGIGVAGGSDRPRPRGSRAQGARQGTDERNGHRALRRNGSPGLRGSRPHLSRHVAAEL